MRFGEYCLHVRTRLDRSTIHDEWIARALRTPVRREVQSDGRIRCWVYIPEAARFLRVIVLPDGETVHNVFFDRRFRP